MLDLVCSVSQLGKEMPQLFLHRGFCAQAQVRGDLFACPVPDRLVGIEIRTIARQIHQSQAQLWSSQVGTHGIRRPEPISRPVCFSRSCFRKAVEVSALLFPSNSISSTSPVSRHTAELAGLFAPPGAGRIYQRWLSFEYPFPPQVRIRPEMGLRLSEEDLRSHLLRLGQAYTATKASRLASSAFRKRFFGRFRTNPNRCR